MREIFNMKRRYLSLALPACLSLFASCADEGIAVKDTEINEAVPGQHTVIINAGDAGLTRTAISPDGNGFKVSWQEGDQINLFEVIPSIESVYDQVKCYTSASLTSSNINNGAAQFSVSLDDERSDKDAYKYLAVYPCNKAGNSYSNVGTYNSWESDEDDAYNNWKSYWNYNGIYVAPHPTFSLNLPDKQRPTASSFDASADLMVSELKETNTQFTEYSSMKFARVGSIICITCKGLDAYKGQEVTGAEFGFGDSYGGNSVIDYDPYLKKLQFYKGLRFQLYPQNVTVKDDGTVDLWIRGFSGKITDWCSLRLVVGGTLTSTDSGYGYTEETIDGGTVLSRKIDLASLSKSITMEEGEMTKFGVSNFVNAVPRPETEVFYLTNDTGDGVTINWLADSNTGRYEYWFKETNSETAESIISGEAPITDGKCQITIDNGLTSGKEYYLYVKSHTKSGFCYDLAEERCGMTEWQSTFTIELNKEGTTSFGPTTLYYHSYTEEGELFDSSNAKSDTEYAYASSYEHLMLGFMNVNTDGSTITPLNSATNWAMYTKMPLKKIKKVRVYYSGSDNDFKVYLDNVIKGKTCSITYSTSGQDRWGTKYYEYDFTSLSETYQYLTICDDDSTTGTTTIAYVEIDYIN